MMAPSYHSAASSSAGSIASLAESCKITKYAFLPSSYIFSPVAIESFGAFGPHSRSLLQELGRCIRVYTGKVSSTSYLLQRLAIALQRVNALLIMDTLPQLPELAYCYY
jgi:hypothetical protein